MRRQPGLPSTGTGEPVPGQRSGLAGLTSLRRLMQHFLHLKECWEEIFSKRLSGNGSGFVIFADQDYLHYGKTDIFTNTTRLYRNTLGDSCRICSYECRNKRHYHHFAYHVRYHRFCTYLQKSAKVTYFLSKHKKSDNYCFNSFIDTIFVFQSDCF